MGFIMLVVRGKPVKQVNTGRSVCRQYWSDTYKLFCNNYVLCIKSYQRAFLRITVSGNFKVRFI